MEGCYVMRKAIKIKREKCKWLTALCLCLLCFSLCLSMLIKPTYADEPGYLEGLERIGAWRWDDTNWGQKKDSFGDMQGPSCAVGGTFTEAGVLGWARYRLGGAFTTFSGKLACADAGTADAAMRLNIYADSRTEPVYTSPVIRRDTRIFAFQADVIGANEIRVELVQAEAPTLPEGQASSASALLVDCYLLKAKRTEQSVHLKDAALLDSTWSAITFTGQRDARDNWHQTSAKLGGVLGATSAMGTMGQARYQLDNKYDTFYGQLACAEDGAADAVMQVKFYAGGSATPLYTSPLIKRGTGLAEFRVDVSGVAVLRIEVTGTTDPVSAQSPLSGWVLLSNPYLNPVAPEPTTTTAVPTTTLPPPPVYTPVAGWTGVYRQTSAFLPSIDGYVYSFTANPATDPLLLRVYAKTTWFPDDIRLASYFGSYNNAQLVLMALKGVTYPESVTVGGRTIRFPFGGALMIYAQDRFYTLAEAFAQNILRSEHIAAIAEIFDLSVLPDYPPLTAAQLLKLKEDFLKGLEPEYYVNALQNNVYLRLRRDGRADFAEPGAAIWAGPDLTIGTLDDRALTLREGSFFYEESPGVWKFVVSRFAYEDSRWAAWDTAPTTTAPTTSTTGSIETSSTTNGFLTTTDTEGPPKTGVPFNAGLLVCVALLFLGCVYCGYRVFKKERA